MTLEHALIIAFVALQQGWFWIPAIRFVLRERRR